MKLENIVKKIIEFLYVRDLGIKWERGVFIVCFKEVLKETIVLGVCNVFFL